MNINVHIVAPYSSMVSIIEESIPLFPELNIGYSVGDLDNGVQQAADAERKGADVIVSRGGTARSIQQAVTIPVIDIQLSGYDMIRSLLLASGLQEKTAIVGFANIASGAQAIIDLLDLPLKAFTVTSSKEVPDLILDLKNRGYKQIAGDVITLETANAYGLKGFLIHSGKESMIRALDDARMLVGYLHRGERLARVFELFIHETHPNLIVVDERGRVVYRKFGDFGDNPLTEERLVQLGGELRTGGGRIARTFPSGDHTLTVEGTRYSVGDEVYALYLLHRNELPPAAQEGVSLLRPVDGGPLADNSPAIRRVLRHARTLYGNGEPLCLQGAEGTGKHFIADDLHRDMAAGGLLLEIDLKRIGMREVEALALSAVATVRLLHTRSVDDEGRLIAFIRGLRERRIRVLMLEEEAPNEPLLREADIALLLLPPLSERREDIPQLAHFFLSDCNQRLGTTAVKLQAAAQPFLLSADYPQHIDSLKNLIKQAALNESDYVIRLETLQKVTADHSLPAPWRTPRGTLKEIEKTIIREVLQEENQNQSRTAERLGINRATLWRKLKE
ncbi:PrpR N-terminal domain-containing protein [Saccharibacillus sp. CPCC 101409]|uniref:sigma-54-dependent Fis family transcriptional regulator n=1 Tax=Saccharibacillus sp. CPCC 101409 TaxID=3058041 RepID=UPI002672A7FB|nr:sigma-54-dependent Fis family transcriptional regulator [Saccharibacillus sp. CPCC 101409]MDO3412327.1 PrpR N-terminal domain-containing protein [Saccharibacillus sp. CPCC 101409]